MEQPYRDADLAAENERLLHVVETLRARVASLQAEATNKYKQYVSFGGSCPMCGSHHRRDKYGYITNHRYLNPGKPAKKFLWWSYPAVPPHFEVTCYECGNCFLEAPKGA